MTLNRLLVPCYRVIATTDSSRTEFSPSDFWTEAFAWAGQHESPYAGFEYALNSLPTLVNGNAHGFTAVLEKDYHNISYIILGIENLETTVIPPQFSDE